jgi:hypothetical protein
MSDQEITLQDLQTMAEQLQDLGDPIIMDEAWK